MARKSVNVQELKAVVNESLRVSLCSPDVRHGMCNVLERVLHSAGQYEGFRYLTADEVPAGQKPGIINSYSKDGWCEPKFDSAKTDNSRVEYL